MRHDEACISPQLAHGNETKMIGRSEKIVLSKAERWRAGYKIPLKYCIKFPDSGFSWQVGRYAPTALEVPANHLRYK